MTFDLNTVANVASVLCLPATLIGAIDMFLVIFPVGRGWMERHSKTLLLGVIVLASLGFLDIVARSGWLSNNELEQVFNQSYHNRTVKLDNKEFVDCLFENVTLFYNGGPFKLENSRMAETIRIETTSNAADHTMVLIDAVYRSAADIKLLRVPKPND